jgi:WD40 repeat protein
MSYVVRASKFRHVFGEPKKDTYQGVNSYSGTPEGNGLAGNAKFVGVSWNTGGGGALAVLPQDRPARLGTVVPLIKGHSGPVLDFDFNPFNDYHVATASEDGTAKLWQVGLTMLNKITFCSFFDFFPQRPNPAKKNLPFPPSYTNPLLRCQKNFFFHTSALAIHRFPKKA